VVRRSSRTLSGRRIEFHCSNDLRSTADRFFIFKRRRRVEEYLDLLENFRHTDVVELGIRAGGSAALTTLVARPRKLVAIDLLANRVEALDELTRRLALGERLRPYYGVDQADRAQVRAIIDDEFGDGPLDLVIDDASHRLEATRASFETLFPRLRAGGIYLIEDWNKQKLSRALGEALADPDSPAAVEFARRMAEDPTTTEGPVGGSPAKLILEIVLAQAESEDFLSGVNVGYFFVGVRRGPGHLDPMTFRLSDLFTTTWDCWAAESASGRHPSATP
jgi:hypothetical protein